KRALGFGLGLQRLVPEVLRIGQRLGDRRRTLVELLGQALPQDLAGQDEEQHEGDADPELGIGEDAAMVARGIRRPGCADHRLPPLTAAATLPVSAAWSASCPASLL